MMAAKKKVADTAPEAVQETAKPAEVSHMEYAVNALNGLNLRKEPGLEAEVLAVLPKGVGVWPEKLPDGETGWVRVETGVLTGWVMAKYLAPMPAQKLNQTDGAE